MAKYDKWIEPDGLLRLEGWARDGLTDEQIAKNIGIATSTLYEWKKRFEELSEALKRGKEVVDILVENALLKKALGYRYLEETNTKEGIVTLEKFAHGDVTAQIFWLKNRKPNEWRDKQQVEHSGNISNEVVIEIGVEEDD